MQPEKLETYKKIIEELEIDNDYKKAMISFIETYDGSNRNEFNRFIDLLMVMLHNYMFLRSKAESYDLLELNHQDFTENIDEIKEDFRSLEEGKYPYRGNVSIKPIEEEDDSVGTE